MSFVIYFVAPVSLWFIFFLNLHSLNFLNSAKVASATQVIHWQQMETVQHVSSGMPTQAQLSYAPRPTLQHSRRSSTSLSLVGTGETPTELRDLNNVYDRVQTFSSDSPISPPVHPRCRSTTDYTTTQKSMQSTTPTPKFQCTRSQCPSKSPTLPTGRSGQSGQCTPMCFRSPPPGQQYRSPSPQQCAPCASTQSPQFGAKCPTQLPCGAKCAAQSPCGVKCSTQSPPYGAKCTTRSPCTMRCTSRSPCTNKCATQSPPPCTGTTSSPVDCSTLSPCTAARTATASASPTKCVDKVSGVATCPTRPSMPTRMPTMPTVPTMYTPSSPAYTTGSPTCTGTPSSAMRAAPRSTSRSPDCTTSTTPICTGSPSTPRSAGTTSTPTCSPGVQSVDSRGAQCPLESCRDNCRSNLCSQKDELQAQQKMCPLDLCKMRAGLTAGPTGPTGVVPSRPTTSASRSICSSPTGNQSTKRAPFPSKKTDDESGGGVVRWTEKCSQRCKRPTWNSNRWNCDKPATRACNDCTGAHPAVSRCAQDYDAHRFGAVDGRAMRKCDCCDKRSYPPMMPNQLPSYQTIDRGPPISSCGCDGYARGVNHFRKPPVMPQNPFDNSNSAYFNRLHKGLPFSAQPPPPPPGPPSFSSMPQPPFNPPFNHPPANVSTVTTRDNSLNVLQDNENFSSPMKSCGGCDPGGPPDSPNQNINMVTNPHMFNSVYLPHNSGGPNVPNHHYMYGNSKESNI